MRNNSSVDIRSVSKVGPKFYDAISVMIVLVRFGRIFSYLFQFSRSCTSYRLYGYNVFNQYILTSLCHYLKRMKNCTKDSSRSDHMWQSRLICDRLHSIGSQHSPCHDFYSPLSLLFAFSFYPCKGKVPGYEMLHGTWRVFTSFSIAFVIPNISLPRFVSINICGKQLFLLSFLSKAWMF